MADTPVTQAPPQDADEAGESSSGRGFLGRILNVLSGGDAPGAGDGQAAGETAPGAGIVVHGMGNLRRMRVEDVA
ncbi:MAG: hypothetical protein RLZZ528_2098, partial [Pseudomonadota bacterium]